MSTSTDLWFHARFFRFMNLHQKTLIQQGSGWQRQTILGLFPLFAGMSIIAGCVFVPQALNGNADFRQLYAGAYMVRTGLRHHLYDLDVQQQIENRVISPSAQVLPANHPAYEYALLAPLTFCSYRSAYWAWLFLNLVLAFVCARQLARSLDPWLAVALVGGFVPVACALLQGQDTVWMLFVFMLAWSSSTEFKTGALLGLGAFRFHVLIPVLLVYMLWGKWRVLKGLLLTAAPAAVGSVLLVGISGSLRYLREASSSTEVRNGPLANVYGLCQALWGHNRLALIVTFFVAVLALWYASRRKSPSLATATLVIPLASIHLQVHDLVVLLIPIAAAITSYASVVEFAVATIGLFPPISFLSGLPSALMLIQSHPSGIRSTRPAAD